MEINLTYTVSHSTGLQYRRFGVNKRLQIFCLHFSEDQGRDCLTNDSGPALEQIVEAFQDFNPATLRLEGKHIR